MRRLPVFFVLDVSESMIGENLYRLEQGVGAILRELRTDPHALESVWVSVIGFAGAARTLSPLSEIAESYAPKLPIGGGTALGAALDHVMRELDRTVVRTTPQAKGDWKPIVFLMTDGYPTDDPAPAIARWNRDWAARATLVAVSIGAGADHRLLAELTDHVVSFDDSAHDNFARFIQWVTLSIQVHSRSIGLGDEAAVLAEPNETVTKVDLAKHDPLVDRIDDRFAVFVARCQNTRLPYLIKFERPAFADDAANRSMIDRFAPAKYQLRSTYPVDESYFELSGAETATPTVNSEQLEGLPGCPHCGTPFGLAHCACDGLHCVSGDGEQRCPWCGNIGLYGRGEAGGFDITRGRG